jgi:hypothetical protein
MLARDSRAAMAATCPLLIGLDTRIVCRDAGGAECFARNL